MSRGFQLVFFLHRIAFQIRCQNDHGKGRYLNSRLLCATILPSLSQTTLLETLYFWRTQPLHFSFFYHFWHSCSTAKPLSNTLLVRAWLEGISVTISSPFRKQSVLVTSTSGISFGFPIIPYYSQLNKAIVCRNAFSVPARNCLDSKLLQKTSIRSNRI